MKTWEWICVIVAVVISALIIFSGCEEQLTKGEWYAKYVPKDVNEAQAMAILVDAEAKAEAKLKTIETMNTIKTYCIIGIVGAVVAIAIGLALHIRLAAILGIFGLLGCFAGYGLALAELVYGKYIAIVGSAFSVIVLSAVIFIVCRALIQIVKGGEWFKKEAAIAVPNAVKLFKEKQKSAQNGSVTEKIVDNIKKKL